MLETVTRTDTAPLEAPAVVSCEGCGATVAPDGACLEIGACARADRLATRGASRVTAKTAAAPAAWTGSGRVD